MQVYYKRLIEGITTAAIIQNGGYHFVHMSVYEDGTIDCWKRISIDETAEQLKKGWLVTSVPEGGRLSIHGLGAFTVKNACWNFSNESYVEHIYGLVKNMNKEMIGLFQKRRNKRQNGKSTM